MAGLSRAGAPPAGRPGLPRAQPPGRAAAPGAWPRRGTGAGVLDVGPEPAVQVLCSLHDPPDALRGPDLGDGDVTGDRQHAGRRRGDPPRGLPQCHLHRAQVDITVGGLHGNGLEGRDGEAELLPLAGVFTGHREHPLTQAEAQRTCPAGQQLAQPFPGAVGVDDVTVRYPRGFQAHLAEPLAGGGDLLTEADALVDAGDHGEEGPAGGSVGRYDDEVDGVCPGHRRLYPVQDPRVAVLLRGHGEFGRIVAGKAVRGDGQHHLAPPGTGEQRRSQLLATVGLYGGCGGAGLQQRDARQGLGRLPQHQAERDGIQARPAVLRVQQQAQQVRLGESGPQSAVEVVGDGARHQRGTGHRVRHDPGEHPRAASAAACCSSVKVKSTSCPSSGSADLTDRQDRTGSRRRERRGRTDRSGTDGVQVSRPGPPPSRRPASRPPPRHPPPGALAVSGRSPAPPSPSPDATGTPAHTRHPSPPAPARSCGPCAPRR